MVHSHTPWDGMGWDGNSMYKRLHWNTLSYQRSVCVNAQITLNRILILQFCAAGQFSKIMQEQQTQTVDVYLQIIWWLYAWNFYISVFIFCVVTLYPYMFQFHQIVCCYYAPHTLYYSMCDQPTHPFK